VELIPAARTSTAKQEQNLARVILRVTEVRLIPYEAALERNPTIFGQAAWRGIQTVVVMVVSVENLTGKVARVQPNRGVVLVGNEQAELSAFTAFSDNVGGDLQPNVLKDGYVVFGLKRYAAPDVKRLRLLVTAPLDEANKPLAGASFALTMNVE